MKKRNFWKDIKRFAEPIRHLPKKYTQVVLQKIFDAIFAIGSVWFLEQAINSIETGDSIGFKSFVLFYFGATVLFHPINYLLRYWSWNFYPASRKFLDKKYIGKFIVMDNNETEGIGTGRIIAIVANGLNQWMDLLKVSAFDGLRSVLTVLFGFFYITTIIHWDILYVIGGVGILAIIIHFINKIAIRSRKKRRDVQHKQMRAFVRIIMSKFEILQSKKKEFEIQNLWNLHNEWYVYHKKTVDHMRVIFSLPIFLIGILTAIVVRTYGNKIITTGSGFGELTALLVVLGLIGKMLRDLVDFYRRFTKEWVHVEKVFELFEDAKYIEGYEKGSKFNYKAGHIEIRNLIFQYTKGDKIFNDFSLTIEGKKKTALVGISGSGKSTLVKLISGYLSTSGGNIIVDDQKLKNISLKSYYKHIGYLTQEPSIFDGTIRENMMYAIEGKVSEMEIKSAIKSAKCEFLYKFQDGLETEIGEKGIRLSGGQRQRLAIAKIFLKNPEIIILDEPTSALDSFAEEKITKAMHNLYRNRTVIIVAHRLQTVKEADDIIVMDEGEIIERGTHKSLTKKKGYYAKMLELQSGF